MNRVELNHILKLLERIKNTDEQVEKAKAFIRKDLANMNARRGQLRDTYDIDTSGLGV